MIRTMSVLKSLERLKRFEFAESLEYLDSLSWESIDSWETIEVDEECIDLCTGGKVDNCTQPCNEGCEECFRDEDCSCYCTGCRVKNSSNETSSNYDYDCAKDCYCDDDCRCDCNRENKLFTALELESHRRAQRKCIDDCDAKHSIR